MCDLLAYLQQYDKQWRTIPIKEMKTTAPRTLIANMNTYVARFLAKPDQVQKVIDALPQSRDQSADLQVGEKRSRTLSDNLSQNDEEIKTGEKLWEDQACMNSNDQPLNAQKNVRKGSKAGPNTPDREQAHQETPQQAVITPDQ